MSQYVESNGLMIPFDTAMPDRQLFEENIDLKDTMFYMEERIADLEFALEDQEWILWDGTTESDTIMSVQALHTVSRLSRIMYLKNPLIERGVDVARFYVWAQGISITCRDETIQEKITSFLDEPKNQVELTGHQARMLKEKDLRCDGNLFFVFFVNADTGGVVLRSIPFSEVFDVVCNPDDAKEPWYYKRRWRAATLNFETGEYDTVEKTEYYPDYRYVPVYKPDTIGGDPVHWDRSVKHVRIGGFSDWKFGVSEVYAAIDWAKAYKSFLEDWATIVRAYRRFAWQVTSKGTKKSISSAKRKLNTGYPGAASALDPNPAPATGSIFIGSNDEHIAPIKTSGATISAEDGRRMLLMAAAALGLPETFFGDVSVGTLATAKSLDRPTELAFVDRQTLWAGIMEDIIEYALLQLVKAGDKDLSSLAEIQETEEEGRIVERLIWNDGVEANIDIDFPPIVQEDVQQKVNAIKTAATLDGGKLAGTMPMVEVAKMMFVAIGESNIDDKMTQLFDEDGHPLFEIPKPEIPPASAAGAGLSNDDEDEEPVDGQRSAEAIMLGAVAEMRDALIRVRGSYDE